MIVVTGTKRSGTSMWMQILTAAGFPVVGTAFPKDWERRLKPLNPKGFFESKYRGGVNFTNNPDPNSGAYLAPRDVRRHAVKIFIPGLVTTEIAFLDRVVATVRDWRSYAASRKRLEAFDRAGKPEDRFELMYAMPAPLEWWFENYGLIRDAAVRGYPVHMLTYDAVVRDPVAAVTPVLEGLGCGDAAIEAGVAAVGGVPDAHRWSSDDPEDIDAADIATFDALWAAVADGARFSPALLDAMDETNARLRPRIVAIAQDTQLQRAARWRRNLREDLE